MLTASFGLLYPITAHRFGWPFAAGGSQSIVDALAGYFRSLGGEIETGRWVQTPWRTSRRPRRPSSMSPPGCCIGIAGDRAAGLVSGTAGQVPARRRRPSRSITRSTARSRGQTSACAWRGQSTSVLRIRSPPPRSAIWKGRRPARPFILVAQQSMSDPSRAPEGKHTLWAYAHVPSGSTEDFSGAIEHEIEHLAPGFRDLVIERCIAAPDDLAAYNPNYAGGDITGGAYTVGTDAVPPGPGPKPICHAGQRDLPLLVIDPTGSRGARNVWLLGGPDSVEEGLGLGTSHVARRTLTLAASSHKVSSRKTVDLEPPASNLARTRLTHLAPRTTLSSLTATYGVAPGLLRSLAPGIVPGTGPS